MIYFSMTFLFYTKKVTSFPKAEIRLVDSESEGVFRSSLLFFISSLALQQKQNAMHLD